MTYKEFKQWCNIRATEGTWSLKQAKYCIDLINLISAYPFWKREKIWKQDWEYITYLQIIKPINDLLGSDDNE